MRRRQCLSAEQSKQRKMEKVGMKVDEVERIGALPFLFMKNEKPAIISSRVYLRHRRIIKKWASRQNVSDGEIVRRALDGYAQNRDEQKAGRASAQPLR